MKPAPMKPHAVPTAQPARVNRMTLASVKRGPVEAPMRVIIQGTDGVGKSTFAAGAPSPIFLGVEAGTNHLDVARFPSPESWQDVLDALRTLTEDAGGFKTLVVDSLDWAEPLLWASVTANAKAASIEDVGGGYGRGYSAALDGWRVFLGALEELQRKQGMHVVLIAHSFIKSFKNPEGEDFDRYILKLNDKAAGLLREWADAVLFAKYETFAVKEKSKVRGVSSGARLLMTERTAAYDAKNRYGLPESLPLSWDDFMAAKQAGRPVESDALAREVEAKAKQLGGEYGEKALAALARANGDASKLAFLNNQLNFRLAQKEDNNA